MYQQVLLFVTMVIRYFLCVRIFMTFSVSGIIRHDPSPRTTALFPQNYGKYGHGTLLFKSIAF
jgi:hypothetical protein